MKKKSNLSVNPSNQPVCLWRHCTRIRKTFFFNYATMPAYTTDSANGDVYANSFEFGVYLDQNTRMGVFNEQVSADGFNFNVNGISAEYDLLQQNQFATAVGVMMGNSSGAATDGSVADIYGRFVLHASDNANIHAKLAYRTASVTVPAGANNMNGIGFSIGFGIGF
ncbi:MAG: hypothetical protein IBX55_22130 [Methyloprofundus sp.]|nr:hypothetical protein [Methyloprofundus sp.]